MTILITGASGAIGLPTLHHLVKRGARVRALSSRDSSAANLKSLGVAETVVGDLTSDADVARAMQGVASVMHIPPRFREDEAKIGLRVLKAAVDAKVGHFVFSSVFHPQMRDMDHHFNKLVVEEALIDSGLAFTILQPAMFMQNIRLEWPGIRDRGVYLRPYSPDQRMAMIDTEDYGEAAARVLTEPGYRGGIFELAGPDQLTTGEMAKVIAEEWGRPVRAESARSTSGNYGPRRTTGIPGPSKPTPRCAITMTSTAMPAAIRWCCRRSSAVRPAATALS
jgi:uncharacterized protein YbjT (DUF2867 family)